MAKRITERRRSPEQIRARAVEMLAATDVILGTAVGDSFTRGCAWAMERMIAFIDGDDSA